ncbi:alcohol oxidase [Mycena maculata]|uniref:Alcohol oxidase n=1 Tax=Mycena maculata TaxID=230809 RepID=A0AAD7MQW1_9AGAR|nr:alcohol oxidase [Mycena maculata]
MAGIWFAALISALALRCSARADLAVYGITDNPVLFSQQSFDILIAGGGTAGVALATRLAATTSLNIGIIEAGDLIQPGQNALVDTPALTGQSFTNPNLSWGFTTSPQAHVGTRTLDYPRGKMIGGSSGLNSMAWVRPPRQELDVWQRLGISSRWSWDALLPYMMKTENVSLGDSSAFPGSIHPSGYDSNVQGRTGPIRVGYDNTFSVQRPYIQSILNAGASLNQDPENGTNIGVSNSQHSVNDLTGNRSYATTGYLLQNQGLRNLLVLKQAMVSKVNFTKTPAGILNATGLEYSVGGTIYCATASREVVLSMGVLQTPQILELSGIGNKTLLQSLGITTLVDAPTVGENFQDHVSVPTTFLLKDPAPLTLDALEFNSSFAIEQQQQYLDNHTGFFTMLPTYSYHPIQTFFSQDVPKLIDDTRAELENRLMSPFQKLQAEIQLEWLQNFGIGQIEMAPFSGGIPGLPVPLESGRSYISIVAFAQHPFSRGSVHARSQSILDSPIFNPNIFDFDFDRTMLSMGIELAQLIAGTAPLSDLIETIVNPSPGSDLESYTTTTLGLEYNGIGTASLGPQNSGGIVSDDLIVYGTSNLRVVDASVIPLHLSSHIQSVVYAIAEQVTV